MSHALGTLLAASTTDTVSTQSFFDGSSGYPYDGKVSYMTAKSVFRRFVHFITLRRCTNVVRSGID